jgi:hypothetical protein
MRIGSMRSIIGRRLRAGEGIEGRRIRPALAIAAAARRPLTDSPPAIICGFPAPV